MGMRKLKSMKKKSGAMRARAISLFRRMARAMETFSGVPSAVRITSSLCRVASAIGLSAFPETLLLLDRRR
jgi:hypothetical protein